MAKNKAGDIMTTNVITVTPMTKVKEAIRLMVENEVSGLPVVDEDGKVVGLLTEADALEARTNQNTESAMTKRVYKAKPGDSVNSIRATLMKQKIKRVPVVDKAGKLVGVVSRRDVLATKL